MPKRADYFGFMCVCVHVSIRMKLDDHDSTHFFAKQSPWLAECKKIEERER